MTRIHQQQTSPVTEFCINEQQYQPLVIPIILYDGTVPVPAGAVVVAVTAPRGLSMKPRVFPAADVAAGAAEVGAAPTDQERVRVTDKKINATTECQKDHFTLVRSYLLSQARVRG